jgi:predicted TIM-barrel fold metal-dependent hydrolase
METTIMAAPQLDSELFLPDPEPREVKYTIISVDDHVVEPPHLFERYLPPALREKGPQLIETPEGHEVWQFFEQMRPGCYDADARIKDMDLGGIWAQLNFPSQITGFCGRVFAAAKDREVGLACVQAWNDWLFEEWYSPYPDRIIPCGITYLSDPQLAAAEIRRNAERGFVSVTFPERPHAVGLPNLWDRAHWDPIIEACAETETVISLHVGSSGTYPLPEGSPVLQLSATLFGQLSLAACAEWLWSAHALRHPTLAIAMSEGGIGWVAMLLDRLDNLVDRSGYGLGWDVRPADIMKRNFWFCTLDDPSTIDTRNRIGVENILFETDYPHGDGTWPDSQSVIEEVWSHVPANEIRMMCSENAAKLYRHPLPEVVLPKD